MTQNDLSPATFASRDFGRKKLWKNISKSTQGKLLSLVTSVTSLTDIKGVIITICVVIMTSAQQKVKLDFITNEKQQYFSVLVELGAERLILVCNSIEPNAGKLVGK